MKKSLRYSLSAIGLVSLAGIWHSQAAGYNIILDQVHETITRAAVDCAARTPTSVPAGCALDRADLKARAGNNNSAYKEAVRWADNPLRQNNPLSGGHAVLNSKSGRCIRLLKRYADNIQNAGLPCRTHFGDLQFWHAMRSSPTETTAVTRAKILSWARFNYRVARGIVTADSDFCQQFKGDPTFDSAMVPPNFAYCTGSADPWTVGEFYTFSCPTNPINCNPNPNPALVKKVAIGAILHMIQDSYSQTHALRTDSPVRNRKQKLVARVECGKPRSYEHYNKKTSKAHSQADDWPDLGACTEGAEADDVITASARAIYHVTNSDEDKFIAYLEDRVF
jgi:hypothetical protein